jgi:hypothetical protein
MSVVVAVTLQIGRKRHELIASSGRIAVPTSGDDAVYALGFDVSALLLDS